MAALTGPYIGFPGKASGNLSATQFTFLKPHTTAGQYATAGAGEAMVGIQNEKPDAAGKDLEVVIGGRFKLVVDGSGTAIAAGDRLKSDASGRGVKVSADLDKYGAIALEASSAAADIISVIVVPGHGVHGE